MSFKSVSRISRRALPQSSAPMLTVSTESRSSDLAHTMSAVLRRLVDAEPGGLKGLARKLKRAPRTLHNWMDAQNAPDGESLLALMRQSDEALGEVLRLVGRADLLDPVRREAVARKLDAAVAAIKDSVG